MEEIGNSKHPEYKYAQSLLREGERSRLGYYLVETANFVQQALASRAEVSGVFALAKEAERFAARCVERGVPLYVLSAGLMNKLVGTSYETAVTAIATVKQGVLTPEQLPLQNETLLLAGERIQDPRNVGVLVRTAEAAGCTALLLSQDSADPFSRASVRSSTGSIVRLPICQVPDLPAVLRQLQEQGVQVVASSARAPHTLYEAPLAQRPLLLLVGNETEGLTEQARVAASEFVRVPMSEDGPSSLNVTVATGVLLFEAIRQFQARNDPS
ncbi:MAG TPA: RNA methyltransferase [Chthonomonadaceae bacterium]|nr:RNA methyltransferase [Chthonomonadaceae bacterium]